MLGELATGQERPPTTLSSMSNANMAKPRSGDRDPLEVTTDPAREIMIEGGLNGSDAPNFDTIVIDVASTRDHCQVRLYVPTGIVRKTASPCRNREEIVGKS